MDDTTIQINIEYKVLVSCMTYNQSKYIEDALNGFVRQQTDFPFVCLVMDDASTDGEQDVIRAFLGRECDMTAAKFYDFDESEVLILPHKTNMNCTFAVYFLKKNLYGTEQKTQLINEWRKNCKYEAICEGDDYWIDPTKLQKQVVFLEENPDYSMCFHRSKVLLEKNASAWTDSFSIEDRDYSATEVFVNWIVPTASILFRVDCLEYQMVDPSRILNGDLVLVEKCAHSGRIRGMSDFMSVYRISPSGITQNSAFHVKRCMAYPAHYECFLDSFPLIERKEVLAKISKRYFNRIFVRETRTEMIYDWKKSFQASKSVCLNMTRKKLKYLIYRKVTRW